MLILLRGAETVIFAITLASFIFSAAVLGVVICNVKACKLDPGTVVIVAIFGTGIPSAPTLCVINVVSRLISLDLILNLDMYFVAVVVT